jgi:ParB family chromosome partitioning protein
MARTKLLLTASFSPTTEVKLTAGTSTVAVREIRQRKDGDARELSAAHVVTLAESIAALGILEPVVVDLEGHLLAGGHRLAALQLLAEHDGEARRALFLGRLKGHTPKEAPPEGSKATAPPKSAWEALGDRIAAIDTTAFAERYPRAKVPVVAVDVSEKAGPDLALAVEAAENSVRRQYSREEVQKLAAKLKRAGYISREGRPRTGEKSARPMLEALLGCSGRHLSRLLGKDDREAKSGWDRAVAALKRAAARVEAEGKSRRSDENQKLVELAAKISRALASE